MSSQKGSLNLRVVEPELVENMKIKLSLEQSIRVIPHNSPW